MRLDQQLQHQSLVRMLKESIYSMCRNSLAYDLELNVEGLIGITLDKRDVFLVNINESFQTDGQLDDAREKTNSGDTERNAGTPRKRKKRRSSASSSSEDLERGATTSSRNYMDSAPARGSKEYPEEIDDCDAIVIKEEIESDEEKYNIPSGFNFDPAGHSSHMQSSMLPDYDGSGQEFSDNVNNQQSEPSDTRAAIFPSGLPSDSTSYDKPPQQQQQQPPLPSVARPQCTLCQQHFCSIYTLQRHFRVKHFKETVTCNLCGKSVCDVYTLQRHIKADHQGERYKCPHCDKVYKYKDSLKYHMAVHTGEFKCQCDICGRKFNLESRLARHMKERHSSVEETS